MSSPTPPPSSSWSASPAWLQVPAPVRRVFDQFPLITYPPEPLPARCPPTSQVPTLHIWTTPEDAALDNPSFNSSCLRLQTYLKICKCRVYIVPSNNHAAPGGSLPFVLPPGSIASAVPMEKLLKWARENGSAPEHDQATRESPSGKAYLAMVDTQIWAAQIYSSHLAPGAKFDARYSTSSVSVVQWINSYGSQRGARKLLEAQRGTIVADDIYADAEAAFEALANELGHAAWFWGYEEPGELDAAVFAVTYLALRRPRGDAMRRMVGKFENLVGHQERLRKMLYPNAEAAKGV